MMRGRSDLVEGVAVAAAAACLAHCLALPLILAVLPALAMGMPASFHLLALLVAVPSTCAALWLGYRHHGAPLPVAIGLGGLALIATGATALAETRLEAPVTIAGSLLITAAHLANWRLRRRAGGHGLI